MYFIKWKFVDFCLCAWHMLWFICTYYILSRANENRCKDEGKIMKKSYSEKDRDLVIIIQCPLAIKHIKPVVVWDESIVIKEKMSYIPFDCFGLLFDQKFSSSRIKCHCIENEWRCYCELMKSTFTQIIFSSWRF